MDLIPDNWPVIAGKEPRNLYVNENVPEDIVEEFAEKGWEVVDVRALPSATMSDRQTVVLAWLEGVRQQTITPYKGMLDYLELEAQITGLKTGKQQTEAKKLEKGTLDSLLSFNSHRARDTVGKEAGKK